MVSILCDLHSLNDLFPTCCPSLGLLQNLTRSTLVNGSIGKVVGFVSGEDLSVQSSEGRYFEQASVMCCEGNEGQPPDEASSERADTHEAGDANASPPEDKAKGVRKVAEPPTNSALLEGIAIAEAALTERQRRKLHLGPHERPPKTVIPPGKWPVVEFNKTKARMLLPPMSFSHENAQGIDEAIRSQVPLILAWA